MHCSCPDALEHRAVQVVGAELVPSNTVPSKRLLLWSSFLRPSTAGTEIEGSRLTVAALVCPRLADPSSTLQDPVMGAKNPGSHGRGTPCNQCARGFAPIGKNGHHIICYRANPQKSLSGI